MRGSCKRRHPVGGAPGSVAGATLTAMLRHQGMTHKAVRPHQEPLADVGTAMLAVGSFLSGVLIGASGPLFFVSVVVALVAGPTAGGLALLGAIVVGAVATVAVIVGLAAGHRSYFGVATVVGCAALIAGIYVGSSFGSSEGLGGWAVTRATPTPQIPLPSFPTYLEAHADVTIALEAGSGFTPNPTTGGPDGTSGHWCRSGPDSTLVSEVTAHEVAHLGTSTIYADLDLTDPSLLSPDPELTYPRLLLQLGGPSGMTAYLWSGPSRVIAHDAMSGTVAFDALLADAVPPGLPPTLSGQLSWTCRAWLTP